MTLEVKPEVAAALETLAAARGLSVQDYLQLLVERELPVDLEVDVRSEGSGMVSEQGLVVYRTGQPLPKRTVDEAVRRLREQRMQHIMGNRS